MIKNKKNVGHSISQRLLHRSKVNKEDFNLLLSRYGTERFLYRLSISRYSDRFILKGASLFLVWKGQSYRVTRDVDLLSFGNPNVEALADIFRDICEVNCPQDDGMSYISDSLRIEEIREDNEYDGMRIKLNGFLSQAKIPLQIDIGFGDVVTPAPETVEYPTFFDDPAPRMKAYPRYTLVAEKLEAMVRLGIANSRMKDFYDIWLLSKLFGFDGVILSQAIANTFSRRQMKLPSAMPFAFTVSFYEDSQKRVQWTAFVRKSKPNIPVGNLPEVIEELSRFIMPVINALREEVLFQSNWLPDKGWLPSS
ncbi:MAG: nucleotidyl transferase AbiEii/AbiGii toxin family protein [Desulfobacterales bacterium]|jgi:predicted nucleotidyltransferase component of viral defense system